MIKAKKPKKIVLDFLHLKDMTRISEKIQTIGIPCIEQSKMADEADGLKSDVQEEGLSCGYDPYLYITDDGLKAAQYKASGKAVLIYLHADNKEERFPENRYFIEGFEDADETYFTRIYQREMKLPWIIGENERIILREMTLQDKPALYHLYEEKTVTAYMEDLEPDTAEAETHIMEYIDKMYGVFGFGMWLVESKENGEIIGRVGFQNTEEESEAELGFLIAPAYQGKGYAYEACQMAIHDMKKNYPDIKMIARVDHRNTAAIRLSQKLGVQVILL